MNDDDLLLSQLADAFAPEPCAPPAAGLQALHMSIDAARSPQAKSRRLRRRWLLPAAASISALGIGNLALAATGTSVTRLVRSVAHEVRLPVDSPALLDTRQHRDALRDALERDDLAAIARHARQLRTTFAGLDGDERTSIAAEVTSLLGRADARLAEPVVDDDDDEAATSPLATTPEVTSAPAGPFQPDEIEDTDKTNATHTADHTTQTVETDETGETGETEDADTVSSGHGSSPTTVHPSTDESSGHDGTDSDDGADSGAVPGSGSQTVDPDHDADSPIRQGESGSEQDSHVAAPPDSSSGGDDGG